MELPRAVSGGWAWRDSGGLLEGHSAGSVCLYALIGGSGDSPLNLVHTCSPSFLTLGPGQNCVTFRAIVGMIV